MTEHNATCAELVCYIDLYIKHAAELSQYYEQITLTVKSGLLSDDSYIRKQSEVSLKFLLGELELKSNFWDAFFNIYEALENYSGNIFKASWG